MTRWLTAFLLLLGCAGAAQAETPCPTVSDGVSILNVRVSGAPKTVSFAGFDLETSFFTVTFTDRTSQMFIAVPRSRVQAGLVQWTILKQYRQAIMQENSTCPLLLEGSAKPVLPIQAQP